MKRASVAAVILVSCLGAAGAAQAQRSRGQPPPPVSGLPPAAAQMAILAAEDSRLVLPDDLHTPAIDTLRAKQMEDLRLLFELARSTEPAIRTRAIRALGRLERREVIPELLQYVTTGPTETANAIAQAFRGPLLPNDSGGEQVGGALEALASAGAIPIDPTRRPGPIGPVALAIGRLPYERAEQVQAAESYLFRLMRAADSDLSLRPALPDITRGVEILARLRSKLATLSSDTIDELRGIVINRRREYPAAARLNAMMALIAARGVDAETLRIAAAAPGGPSDSILMQVRRLAAVVLGGAGAPIESTERTELLTALLADRSQIVRIEAVRAWARQETPANGCQRLLDAAKRSEHPGGAGRDRHAWRSM